MRALPRLLVNSRHQQAPWLRATAAEVAGPARGISERQVNEFHRARILAAMAEVAAEDGVEHATIAKVVARVRLARRTFYDLFADRHDCLRTVVQESTDSAAARISGAYRAADVWEVRLQAALFELLGLIDRERDLARLCLAQLYSDDQDLSALRARLLAAAAAALDEGRAEIPSGMEPPPLSAEATISAVASILYARLLDRDSTPAAELLGPLMSVLVLPYRGPGAAHRELARPAPAPSPVPALEPVAIRPQQQPHLRLTYRTGRVLQAIAEQPGINNRDVATAAGIKDQGQISKLLARLERTGVIENTGGPSGANAWRLTRDGHQLTRAIGLSDTRGG